MGDWNEAGLKLPSVIRVHKLATLEKGLVEMRMGEVDEHTRENIKMLFRNLGG
jgi:mRNA interferase MazF